MKLIKCSKFVVDQKTIELKTISQKMSLTIVHISPCECYFFSFSLQNVLQSHIVFRSDICCLGRNRIAILKYRPSEIIELFRLNNF